MKQKHRASVTPPKGGYYEQVGLFHAFWKNAHGVLRLMRSVRTFTVHARALFRGGVTLQWLPLIQTWAGRL